MDYQGRMLAHAEYELSRQVTRRAGQSQLLDPRERHLTFHFRLKPGLAWLRRGVLRTVRLMGRQPANQPQPGQVLSTEPPLAPFVDWQ
jgi:hypothetical protein